MNKVTIITIMFCVVLHFDYMSIFRCVSSNYYNMTYSSFIRLLNVI